MSKANNAEGVTAFSCVAGQNSTQEQKPKISKLVEVLICLTMFNEGVQIQLIYPLLRSTVEFYLNSSIGPEMTQEYLGLYCGILTSIYYGAALFSGFLYGLIADRYGRRLVLLCGLFGSTFSAIVFAVSTNYWMALAARFLTGFLDANLAMLKAYIGDVTDHTNQSRVYSNSMFMFALAVTVAPLVSGAFPGAFIPGTHIWLPVFWPCAISALSSGLIGVACYFYLPETASFKARQARLKQGIPDEKPVAHSNSSDSVPFTEKYRSEILAMIFYVLMSFVLYGSDSVFPLLVEDKANGLSLPKASTAFFLMIQGAAWCVFQGLLFRPVTAKIGIVNVFRLGGFLLSTGVPAVFLPSLLNGSYHKSAMAAAITIRGFAQATTFTSIVVIVNNSTTTATKGRITGLAHSLSSGARMIGVLIVSSLWDVGVRNQFVFLPFMVSALTALFMLVTSLALPKSLNRPKPEPVGGSTIASKV